MLNLIKLFFLNHIFRNSEGNALNLLQVCRPDEVISEAVDLAEKIAEINPLYIARIKENANNESILL